MRALAVLPVLIFHAFPDALPGGFYGVDIFFVISGYLISGIIFRGLLSGDFSFCDFYSKRIKRIIPNLIAVLLFVIVVGWFVTTAHEYKKIGGNVSHSALFYQNFTLMIEDDYFGILAQNNPLLHIWSLSIEEQFYLLFPLLCFLIWRIGKYSRAWLGVFVVALTGASFTTCLLLDDQNVRFYLPVSRFWELGVGICIAYAEIFMKIDASRYSSKSKDLLSIVGLMFVLMSLFIPVDWYAPPPGIFNLFPVLGSAFLILSSANSIINRTILSLKWVTFIGLISYSLYLWHWPILAYGRIFFTNPSHWHLWIALLASFVIAVVVYRFIENPIRRIDKRYERWTVIGLIILLLMTYFTGKLIRAKDGVPQREIASLLNFKDDWTHGAGLKKSSVNENLLVVNQNEIPEVVFVGDSHMEQYHSRVMSIVELSKVNVGFMTGGGCMMSIGLRNSEKRCKIEKGDGLDKIIDLKEVQTLVIAQKWGSYTGSVWSNGVNEYNKIIDAFIEGRPDRKVFVLLDQPWDESDNREFNIERYLNGRYDVKRKLSEGNFVVPLPTDQSWLKGNRMIRQKLHGKAIFIETAEKICPNGRCDLKNYRDNDHLRASYVKKNATWIDQVFE